MLSFCGIGSSFSILDISDPDEHAFQIWSEYMGCKWFVIFCTNNFIMLLYIVFTVKKTPSFCNKIFFSMIFDWFLIKPDQFQWNGSGRLLKVIKIRQGPRSKHLVDRTWKLACFFMVLEEKALMSVYICILYIIQLHIFGLHVVQNRLFLHPEYLKN